MTLDALRPVTHGRVWRIAGPIIVSNSTVPIIGLVDTAVIGHRGEASFIAAVALSASVFSSLYWAFGFLRMGTTGFAAQALGARDADEIRAGMQRAGLIALVIGAALIALQVPIAALVFSVFEAGPEVEALARDYFTIRIWGAPAMLLNFVALGWFIGLQRSDIALWLQLYLNAANVALDLLFVTGLGMDVDGVALGTAISEWTGALLGIALAVWYARRKTGAAFAPGDRARLWDAARLARIFAVNRDIFLRSIVLMASFLLLTWYGTRQGDVILAANGILLHFYFVSTYALDGLAFAGEALVGESIGARDPARVRRAAVLSTFWAALAAVAFSLAFLAFGPDLIGILTSVPEVKAAAIDHLWWAIVFPLMSVWSFQLDGFFVGATRTAEMRNMMAVSFAVYVAALVMLGGYGNNGMWAAFILFQAMRAVTLLLYYPRIERDAAAPVPAA